MSNMARAKHRTAAVAALALVLAVPAIQASQNQQEPAGMTSTPQSQALSATHQAIVPIAAFAAAGDIARLNAALNQGLDAGLTVSEAKEVLVQLYAYAGFPRSLNALTELMKVVDARKVVLTNKLKASRWPRTEIAAGRMADEVNALKRQPGANILCIGGAGFASSLVAEGLVDEFQFFVNPVAVGGGRSAFLDHRNGHMLRLLGSRAYECGLVVNRYAPALQDKAPPGYEHLPEFT